MDNSSNNGGGEGPSLIVNPVQYADTTFQAYAERIEDDYLFVVKKAVVPFIGDLRGIKLRELRILASVDFYDAPLSPIQISEILRYDPATVTRATDRLVKAEFAVREENLVDTRSIFLKLTDDGQTLARAYTARVKSVFAELEAQLPRKMSDEEKMEYLTMIVKINKRSSSLRALCKRQKWS